MCNNGEGVPSTPIGSLPSTSAYSVLASGYSKNRMGFGYHSVRANGGSGLTY